MGKNLLEIQETEFLVDSDEMHLARNNQDYRFKKGLLQSTTNNEGVVGNYAVGGTQWTETGLVYYGWSTSQTIDGVTTNINVNDNVTLSNGDATNDRFDVIAVQKNTTEPPTMSIVVVEGTPAANPEFPTLDLTTQAQIGVVNVLATSTEDTSTQIEKVYDENVEWTNTLLPSGATLTSNSDPYIGSVNFKTPAATTSIVAWYKGSLITYDGNDDFIFPLKTTLTKKTIVRVYLRNSVSGNYWLKTLRANELGKFGGSETVPTWQPLQVSLSDFAGSSRSETQYDTVEFRLYNHNELELDWVHTQGDLTQTDPTETTLPFTSMIGRITQTSTNDPVVTIGYNNTGLTPNFLRNGAVGFYTWVLPPNLLSEKIIFIMENAASGDDFWKTISSGSSIQISTDNNNAGDISPADGKLTDVGFEFRIYN